MKYAAMSIPRILADAKYLFAFCDITIKIKHRLELWSCNAIPLPKMPKP